MSGETTFSENVTERAKLEDHLYAMARKVSARSKGKGLAGRVVTLKLKTARFRLLTRRKTLGVHTNLSGALFEAGRDLLRAEAPGERAGTPYRLIGIGLSDLVPAEAMEADLAYPEALRRAGRQEAALDALRARFGEAAIGTIRDQRTRKAAR